MNHPRACHPLRLLSSAALILFVFIVVSPVYSLPSPGTLRVYGSAAFSIPGDELFTCSISGRAGAALPLADTTGFSIEGYTRLGIDTLPSENAGTLLAIPLTVGLEASRSFGKKWTGSLGAGAGGYLAPLIGSPYGNLLGGGPVFETCIDIRRQVRPSLFIGVNGSWVWHLGAAWVLGCGLSFHYKPAGGEVRMTPAEIQPLFPTLYESYRDEGIGDILITNAGNFPIKLEAVSCTVPSYSAAAMVIPVQGIVRSGESIRIPIRLDLDDRILGMVGDFTSSCEITATYRQDSRAKDASIRIPLHILDRNSILWDNDAKACLFITEKDPAVRHFMGQVSGIAAMDERSLVNRNLTLAVATLASFNAFGITYARDPASPYSAAHDPGTVDFLRFPRETLSEKIGDCDDLAILYCALLESVGVETALVTVPGHIFAAVSLEIQQRSAMRQFASWTDLLIIDGEAWLPVETTIMDDFTESWRSASDQYRTAASTGQALFFPVREHWATYPPIALRTVGTEAPRIDVEALRGCLGRMRSVVVKSEMEPLASELITRIEQGTGDQGRTYNLLGVLYARYGQLEKARVAFQSAVYGSGYEPAMVNLANIHLLLGGYREALDLFRVYYVQHPQEPAAVLGISMALFRLGEYDSCAQAYEELERLDPAAAARNAYLVVRRADELEPSRASIRTEEVLWAD